MHEETVAFDHLWNKELTYPAQFRGKSDAEFGFPVIELGLKPLDDG